MKRLTMVCVGAVLALTACRDAVLNSPALEPIASDAEIAAYLPAIDDVRSRILPTALDRELSQRLTAELAIIETALTARKAVVAQLAVARAQELIASCGDGCLAAPERAIVTLTLEHASLLIGMQESRS